MRLRLVVVGLAFLALAFGMETRADDKDPLAPGKNLPGTFHPFNVNSAAAVTEFVLDDKAKSRTALEPYSTKQKFHCLISEYDLDPVIMLITTLPESNAGLRDLLPKLDKLIDRNRRVVRLRAFVVFLRNDLTDLVTQDDKRVEYSRSLEGLAQELGLKNIVLTLGTKADLAKYALRPDDGLTAVLYKKLKVVASHRVPTAEMGAADNPAVKAILGDLATKMGATK